MNLRQIEFFVQVADAGSFSRASAAIGLTQPGISRQVSALEHELNLRLLHRNGRGIVLTEAGQRFLVYARGILHQLDGARHAVTGSETDLAGKVAIGLPPSLGQVLTLPLVKAFRERYRSAELAIMEALSVPLQERLLAGRLDVAVIHNPTPSHLVKIEPMLTELICLLSAARGTRSQPVPFRALERFELIFPGAPHPIRSLVEAEALRRGIKLRVSLEIDAIGMSFSTRRRRLRSRRRSLQRGSGRNVRGRHCCPADRATVPRQHDGTGHAGAPAEHPSRRRRHRDSAECAAADAPAKALFAQQLEYPEKPAPGLDPGVETGFPKRPCSANDGERESNSI